jgi:hypothetical protein
VYNEVLTGTMQVFQAVSQLSLFYLLDSTLFTSDRALIIGQAYSHFPPTQARISDDDQTETRDEGNQVCATDVFHIHISQML